MGYHRAGFDVVGVDINLQPNYPFEFHQADAMTYPLDGFDAIHASPPCQAYTSMKVMWNHRPDHPELVGPVRKGLIATDLPYVIENVPGAPLINPIRLCGSMFGLGVEVEGVYYQLRRHRLFESNVPMSTARCNHPRGTRTIGLYGDHARDSRRTQFSRLDNAEIGRAAMGMPWAKSWHGIREAIPPAYTEWIGTRLMAVVRARAMLGIA